MLNYKSFSLEFLSTQYKEIIKHHLNKKLDLFSWNNLIRNYTHHIITFVQSQSIIRSENRFYLVIGHWAQCGKPSCSIFEHAEQNNMLACTWGSQLVFFEQGLISGMLSVEAIQLNHQRASLIMDAFSLSDLNTLLLNFKTVMC